ncbi:hypothetical protein GGX14DRAFT_391621 [Mycena pura]|uniref:Uncharacterized protein n=1 Tax=Mycena pura TaxID=153505 RepID=A0AAD6VKS0_9AGAR|nr:hypothetical protein GGX14DRAFT_391621 [Mycena pura]
MTSPAPVQRRGGVGDLACATERLRFIANLNIATTDIDAIKIADIANSRHLTDAKKALQEVQDGTQAALLRELNGGSTTAKQQAEVRDGLDDTTEQLNKIRDKNAKQDVEKVLKDLWNVIDVGNEILKICVSNSTSSP